MRPIPTTLCLLLTTTVLAADYDPFHNNREVIKRGVQAVLTCNGLFTSGRSLEQVFAQELAYMGPHMGTAEGGDYRVHRDLRAVEIGTEANPPVLRAVFREGIGCVMMSPDLDLGDIPSLPSVGIPEYESDAEQLPWPDGDLLKNKALPSSVDPEQLQAASDWAFERESPEQVTLSLLVVHKGDIVHERYAEGVDMHTRTRTWSTAKSIAATLIGMRVEEGKMSLDAPLDIEWLPELPGPASDPRNAITLRHVLHMASGWDPGDSFGMEYATGSGFAYWAGAS